MSKTKLIMCDYNEFRKVEQRKKYIGKYYNPITREGFTKNEINQVNKTPYKIIDYENNEKVTIEFLDGNKYKLTTKLWHIERNAVKNLFQPIVYGVGYLGGETDKYPTKENGKESRCYKTWQGMMERCYSNRFNNIRNNYKDCKVAKVWHNYSNFAKWYYENYYEFNGERMNLDKDILYRGNKIYSPKRCVIVPSRINSLLVNCTNKTNDKTGLPVGVNYSKRNKDRLHPYTVSIKVEDDNGQTQYWKHFATKEEALKFYINEKSQHIIRVANIYKKEFIKLYGKDAYKNNMYKFKKMIIHLKHYIDEN